MVGQSHPHGGVGPTLGLEVRWLNGSALDCKSVVLGLNLRGGRDTQYMHKKPSNFIGTLGQSRSGKLLAAAVN